MSDINASIQPENGTQQGVEAPAALSTEAGTAEMGEPLASATSNSVDSQSSTVAQPSASAPTSEATQPSAVPSSGTPQPVSIPIAGEAGNVVAAADAGAPVDGAVPVVGGDLPNVDTGASAIAGSLPAAMTSSVPLTDSVAIVAASGAQATGAEGGDAHAQFFAAMTPAYVSLNDVAASHPAHGFADQIAEHVAGLEGSADSFLVKIATEVKKLVAQIKSVL